MNSDNVFKLNLSLEQLSTVALAVNFWDLPLVKNKIHSHFVRYEVQNRQAEDDWHKVIEHTVKQVNLCFPEKLLWNVKNLVQIFGDKLYNWLRFVTDSLKCDLKYTEIIYWTCNGEIDELKIVKYWLTNSAELGVIHHKCFLKKPLFCIASFYIQEDFIKLHLDEMKSEIFQHLLASHKKMDWNDYAVVATWLCFCGNKNKSSAVRCFRSFNNLPNLPANELFLISIKSGLKFAVQHFFEKLNYDKKQEFIMEAASECLRSYYITSVPYEKDIFVQILFFLIKNMDEIKKLEFITDHFEFLFKKLLYTWPYQEVCLNLLINDPIYLSGIHDILLKRMINDLTEDKNYKAKYFGKGIIYNQIFQTLLEKTTQEVKKNIFLEENYKYLNSLKLVNSDILNLIINDLDLKDYRKDMIPIVETHLQNLILEGGRYRDVNKLMKICFSEEEKSDKQKYNFLIIFLTAGKIKLAEEHFNWLYESDSERLEAKKKIDVVKICTSLIKKSRYDLASEYLNWQCGNEEVQNKVKIVMLLNGVLCDQVYQIWCMHKELESNSVRVVKKKCEQLLRWFLGTQEAMIEFRKTKLIENQSFIEKYWNSLFYHSSFECLGEFLEFCFWSPERIELLRKKIEDAAERWIDTYAVERNNFLMVDSLFKWVFKNDEEKRKKVILKYMESPKGAILILKAFKNVNSKAAILQLLKTWIVSRDPIYIEKIKINVDAFNNGIITDSVVHSIKCLLDEVKKGTVLCTGHVTQRVKNFLK